MWKSLMNKRYLLRFTNCMVAKTCWTQTVINLRWYRIILIMFVVENEKCLGRFFVNATLISRNIIDSNWMTTQVPQTLGFKVTPCKWLKIYKNLLFHNNLAKRAENIWEIKISDFDAKGCKKISILRKYWCSCSYQICTQSLPSYGVVVLCERNHGVIIYQYKEN